MAIQVSGTTVIDDSRNLTNITSVDATTVASISAAGVGGGGTHDFVASGAISNGDVVVLNSDGTVSVVATTPDSAGTPSVFNTHTTETASAFDSLNSKVIIAYRDTYNSYYGTVVVGTVSGTTISFGTPVVFESAETSYISITFDSNSNKTVIAYRNDSTTYGTAIVGTVSGTSIGFGSSVVFNSASTYPFVSSSTFDTNSNKIVLGYRDIGNNSYGTAIVGTVSGSSITFGTPTVFNASGITISIKAVFDSNSNKTIFCYRDFGNNSYGTAIVGTVSGTSISFGSSSVFSSATTSVISASFDSNSNKVVVGYQDGGNSNYGTAIVGTVSGTSIGFGTPVIFESDPISDVSLVFDSGANKIVISYSDTANSTYGTAIVGTVSGTSISFDAPAIYESAAVYWLSSTFDSNSNKTVIAYQDSGNASRGTAVTFQTSSSNASSYIGVAAEDIADTVTGQITITSGINEGQTGLTIGQSYFVSDDGTLTTTNNGRKIGEAFSATNLQVKMNLTGDEMNAYLGGLV